MSSFLFIGTKDARRAAAEQYAREVLGVSLVQNPDVISILHGDIKIADAEHIRAQASRAPFGNRVVFFVDIERATHQAQNTLLKIFEEPHEHTHFLCMAPSKRVLLPTILSRLHEVPVTETVDDEVLEMGNAQAFLTGTIKERGVIIQTLLAQHDRMLTKAFVDALEQVVYTQSNRDALKDIALVQEYVKDNGSSSKLLLEHLMVVLPRFDVA
jgi:DNA polymerase III delta prime subunit